MNILKKIFWIGVISLFFMIIIGMCHQVNAANITYKAEYGSAISYKLTITGLEEEPEKYDLYNAMICQETDVTGDDFYPIYGKHFPIKYNQDTNSWEGISSQPIGVNTLYSGFDKKGQYYVYVAAREAGTTRNWVILDGPTEIETPPLPSLGNRISINPFSYTSTDYRIQVNALDTMLHNGVQRTIRFYVGEVTDENLLKKLSENKESAYDELLQYAKEQEPNLQEDSFQDTKTGTLDYNIVADYPIENGKYYFIHSILDNENGTYNDVEDIEIYNGVSSSQGVRLSSFKYDETQEEPQNGNTINNGNTNSKDNTTATKPLPNAGSSIVAMSILIVTIICVIILYVKNKQYKGIK